MSVAPWINFLTLACRDVEGMADFLRAFGWTEAPSSEPAHRVFQLRNGLCIALYGAEHYVRDYGDRAQSFRGFTLGINVGSRDEVVAVREALSKLPDVDDLDEVFDSPHGFSGFSFRDPEGNIWDVAWKDGSGVSADGDLTWN